MEETDSSVYHCWCAAFDDYLTKNKYKLMHITDKVHIYEK
jgi:hypothetical protein